MPRTGFPLAALLAAAPAAFAQAPVPPAAPQQPPVQPAPVNPQPVPGTPTGRIPTPGGEAPAAPPPAPAVDAALMAHLQGWEKAMKGAANFYTEGALKRTNLLLKKDAEYKASIMCQKPNLARLRIARVPPAGQQPNPNDYTAYICTGKAVYEYDGTAKQVTVIPLKDGGIGDNLLLEFMSGSLTADQAVRRFAIKTFKEKENDPYYVFLDIRPLTAKDKGEFESMTLVLFRPTVPGVEYLPRTVVIRKPNGQEEEVWDFPRPAVNVKIDPTVFQYVPPTADWKVQNAHPPAGPAPAPGQPRVARPMGP